MVYINENKLNKGYINEYNKAYIGDKLLYWNADKYNEGGGDKWITLTSDTPRYIPMQKFRIDITDPGTSGHYFITFSATPNYVGTNAPIIVFSICPDEGTLYDSRTKKLLSSLTKVEGNICEYTFSQVVYFAGGEKNAPLSQVQYKPM